MIRRLATLLSVGVTLAAVALTAWAGPVAAQEGDDGESGGDPESSVTTVPPTIVVAPPTTIPVGCEVPIPPKALFTATYVAEDEDTTRFQLVELRAGSFDFLLSEGEIKRVRADGVVETVRLDKLFDIEFGTDRRFLRLDTTYLIAADINPETGLLRSKIKEVLPRFGENQVLDVGDSATPVDCPALVDQVITRREDGSEIATGLLKPFLTQKRDIVLAFVYPTLWCLAGLIGLVLVKRIVFGAGRMSRRLGRRTLKRRQREHAMARRAAAPRPGRPSSASPVPESPELVR